MKDKFFMSQPAHKPKIKGKRKFKEYDEAQGVFDTERQLEVASNADSDSDNETSQEKRIRLAKSYINHLQTDQEGFDAVEIDKDLVASRLRDNALEQQGKLITSIAGTIEPMLRWKFKTFKPVTVVCQGSGAVYVGTKSKHVLKLDIDGKKVGQVEADGHVYALAECDKYLACGTDSNKIQLWDASTLNLVKVFSQHKDTVTALVFKQTATDLMMYSSSLDRSIKVFNMEALSYVETLFGHQDQVLAMDTVGNKERCVTVGSRDKTVRYWKIPEESQLVFRSSSSRLTKTLPMDLQQKSQIIDELAMDSTGSLDCVACIDDEFWVTGSDSGTLAVWTTSKKKPIYALPNAHGLMVSTEDDRQLVNRENALELQLPSDAYTTQSNWISSVVAVKNSDLVISGSCDGSIRFWRFNRTDKQMLQLINQVKVDGWITSMSIQDRKLAVAVAREHRHGRWETLPVYNKVQMIEF